MIHKKGIVYVSLMLIIVILIMGCAVTKKPPDNEGETPDSSQSDKAPTEEEKQEQTPKNEEELDGPTTAQDVKDGQYEGKTEKDERGNHGEVKITVENGRITEAEYIEYTKDNKPKSKENGYEYQQALDAFEKLPEMLIETQDLSKIDTYAGATGTTKSFKAAVMKALEEGKKE